MTQTRTEEAQVAARRIYALLAEYRDSPDLLGATLAAEIASDHRTHQQTFWRTIQAVARHFCKLTDEYGHDLRNEASVAMTKAMRDHSLPLI